MSRHLQSQVGGASGLLLLPPRSPPRSPLSLGESRADSTQTTQHTRPLGKHTRTNTKLKGTGVTCAHASLPLLCLVSVP